MLQKGLLTPPPLTAQVVIRQRGPPSPASRFGKVAEPRMQGLAVWLEDARPRVGQVDLTGDPAHPELHTTCKAQRRDTLQDAIQGVVVRAALCQSQHYGHVIPQQDVHLVVSMFCAHEVTDCIQNTTGFQKVYGFFLIESVIPKQTPRFR